MAVTVRSSPVPARRLASPEVRSLMRRRTGEFVGIALGLTVIALLVALASHNPADPSLNTATTRGTSNLAGPPGAVVSDLLLQGFGLAGALPGIAMLTWCWRIASHRGIGSPALRILALLSAMPVLGATFSTWTLEAFGVRYDQRNAIVVGLAMGFAVIPIIFAIAEDAFSNVPRNLVSGSLALGASRWQTVTRVVLPTASPGIFAAVMVGFGRAIGETMIVLMATGNTPIMDLSPFDGFRTLSANIAVEIPEAPAGGTLYRTIFLAALLLFALTFAVNTVAELVRQRLRRKYSSL